MTVQVHVVVLLLGCSDVVAPDDSSPALPDVSGLVTGTMARHLDQDGHFLLPEPDRPGDVPLITPSRALDLAWGWVTTWGASATYVEAGHGRPVYWTQLAPSSREVLFAQTSVEAVSQSYPVYVQRHLGPQYLVRYRSEQGPVATVAVAGYSTDLELDSAGLVILPRFSGEEFHVTGVPYGNSFMVPPDPEVLVAALAEEAGALVAAVPRLIYYHGTGAPYLARWELSYDRSFNVVLRDDGSIRSVTTLYVGVRAAQMGQFDLEVSVAASVQPDSLDTEFLWLLEDGSTRLDTVRTARIPGVPVAFDPTKVKLTPR